MTEVRVIILPALGAIWNQPAWSTFEIVKLLQCNAKYLQGIAGNHVVTSASSQG